MKDVYKPYSIPCSEVVATIELTDEQRTELEGLANSRQKLLARERIGLEHGFRHPDQSDAQYNIAACAEISGADWGATTQGAITARDIANIIHRHGIDYVQNLIDEYKREER